LHLSQNLEALETCCLVDVGGDGADRGARGKEVGLGFDFWKVKQSVAVSLGCARR